MLQGPFLPSPLPSKGPASVRGRKMLTFKRTKNGASKQSFGVHRMQFYTRLSENKRQASCSFKRGVTFPNLQAEKSKSGSPPCKDFSSHIPAPQQCLLWTCVGASMQDRLGQSVIRHESRLSSRLLRHWVTQVSAFGDLICVLCTPKPRRGSAAGSCSAALHRCRVYTLKDCLR